MRPSVFLSVQRGVSLVELVLSIVVISVGLAGIIMVINRTVMSSADPMVQDQAVAIAEAYLDEILLKSFCDPSSTCTAGTAFPGATCDLCPAAEATRDLYDNVCDYNSLPDTVVRDQTGAAIASLAAYSVQVNVSTSATIGPTALTSANCQALRVDVTVTGPNNTNYTLSGYRTNYP